MSEKCLEQNILINSKTLAAMNAYGSGNPLPENIPPMNGTTRADSAFADGTHATVILTPPEEPGSKDRDGSLPTMKIILCSDTFRHELSFKQPKESVSITAYDTTYTVRLVPDYRQASTEQDTGCSKPRIVLFLFDKDLKNVLITKRPSRRTEPGIQNDYLYTGITCPLTGENAADDAEKAILDQTGILAYNGCLKNAMQGSDVVIKESGREKKVCFMAAIVEDTVISPFGFYKSIRDSQGLMAMWPVQSLPDKDVFLYGKAEKEFLLAALHRLKDTLPEKAQDAGQEREEQHSGQGIKAILFLFTRDTEKVLLVKQKAENGKPPCMDGISCTIKGRHDIDTIAREISSVAKIPVQNTNSIHWIGASEISAGGKAKDGHRAEYYAAVIDDITTDTDALDRDMGTSASGLSLEEIYNVTEDGILAGGPVETGFLTAAAGILKKKQQEAKKQEAAARKEPAGIGYINNGYRIIEIMKVGDDDTVIAYNPDAPNRYVCWKANLAERYFTWGKYHNTLEGARRSLLERYIGAETLDEWYGFHEDPEQGQQCSPEENLKRGNGHEKL